MKTILSLLFGCLVTITCVGTRADGVPVLSGIPLSGQRLMPLGDSITLGVGDPSRDSYRYQLYLNITGAGGTVQFVGSLSNGDDLPPSERAHEGHGGFLISDLAAGVDAWIAAQPGMTRVTLMIGINDVLNTNQLYLFSTSYGALLDQIHADCPACIIYDMSMLPVASTGPLFFYVRVLNGEIKSLCYHRQTFCRFVDVYSSVTWPTDFDVDGIHPLASGYTKLGNALYSAMRAYQSATLQPY